MPQFSEQSWQALSTCHCDLKMVMQEAIKHYNFSVLEGHRGKERQERLVAEGKSQVHWPDSKHNSTPSLAVDVAPWPVDWQNEARFYLLAGYILGIASQMGVELRWGGDWDQDGSITDNEFDDLGHFELVGDYG